MNTHLEELHIDEKVHKYYNKNEDASGIIY